MLDWLGHVVELSWSPMTAQVDYYLPFLEYSKDAEYVFFFFIYQKNNEYAKKEKKVESNYVSVEVVIHKPWVL